jgi:hypothetical protein
MADSSLRRKRFSAAKALELILAETDSEGDVINDNISDCESDQEFVPNEQVSQIEDKVDTVANSSTDDEQRKDEDNDQALKM